MTITRAEALEAQNPMLPSRTSGNIREPQATGRKSKANVTIARAEALEAQNRSIYILSGTSTPNNFIEERMTLATFALMAKRIAFRFSSVSMRIGTV